MFLSSPFNAFFDISCFSKSVTFTFLMLELKKKKTGTTILVLSDILYTYSCELIVQILGFSAVFFLPK